jgi:hypothetical protein
MWARWGKLVHQLPGVITFAYDLHFRRVIACWKGIFENYTLCCQTLNLSIFDCGKPKKCCLGPQNGPKVQKDVLR